MFELIENIRSLSETILKNSDCKLNNKLHSQHYSLTTRKISMEWQSYYNSFPDKACKTFAVQQPLTLKQFAMENILLHVIECPIKILHSNYKRKFKMEPPEREPPDWPDFRQEAMDIKIDLDTLVDPTTLSLSFRNISNLEKLSPFLINELLTYTAQHWSEITIDNLFLEISNRHLYAVTAYLEKLPKEELILSSTLGIPVFSKHLLSHVDNIRLFEQITHICCIYWNRSRDFHKLIPQMTIKVRYDQTIKNTTRGILNVSPDFVNLTFHKADAIPKTCLTLDRCKWKSSRPLSQETLTMGLAKGCLDKLLKKFKNPKFVQEPTAYHDLNRHSLLDGSILKIIP
jgi:hypothetical protein